jgi:hypothetical protein
LTAAASPNSASAALARATARSSGSATGAARTMCPTAVVGVASPGASSPGGVGTVGASGSAMARGGSDSIPPKASPAAAPFPAATASEARYALSIRRGRALSVVAVMLAGCSHGAPRPAERPTSPSMTPRW